MMKLCEFSLYLDRVPMDDELDVMFESGLDDCTPEIGGGRCVLHVTREAANLDEAILSVIADVERAGFAAVGIEDEDLVPVSVIAERVGRSRESVRLLASGQRGPGGFPPPVTTGEWALYSWVGVAQWFRENYDADLPVFDDSATLAAADLLLRARVLRPQLNQLAKLVTTA